jgi:ASCH domain
MKCLTIRQPWAWLIVNGYKPIENRSWPTKIRGNILIHSSASMSKKEAVDALMFVAKFDAKGAGLALAEAMKRNQLALGTIVGKANLIMSTLAHPSPYFVGPYGHVMTNPQRCEPFAYKGQLGYFDVPDDVVAQLKWID